jgi:serine/threonine protein kinase
VAQRQGRHRVKEEKGAGKRGQAQLSMTTDFIMRPTSASARPPVAAPSLRSGAATGGRPGLTLDFSKICEYQLYNRSYDESILVESLQPGSVINVDEWFEERYEIERYLGFGGSAIAFLATDTLIERKVALKLWHKFYPVKKRKLLDEAKILGQIQHKKIVQLYDYRYDESAPWLALEYLGDHTLRSALYLKHKLPSETVVRLGAQISELLDYLHNSIGYFQVDLKPDNISSDEALTEIRLMDFGSVIRSDGESFRYGTPGYMAPELCSGEVISSASDIFSFGVVVFEMLTGIKPFENIQSALCSRRVLDWYRMAVSVALSSVSDDVTENVVGRRIADEMRKFEPEQYLTSVPQALASLVCAMMAFDKEARPHANDVYLQLKSMGETPEKKPLIFISHSHPDKNPFINKLTKSLKRRGFNIWIDEKDLKTGQPFWETIGEAIQKVDFIIIALSSNSIKSQGVGEEMRMAHLLNLGESVKMLPIRIDAVPFSAMPISLRARHVLDFVGWESEKIFQRKVARLCSDMRQFIGYA